ncbi:MAG: alpha-glucan family phosphorylase, partial [Bacteroidales bacterium]|nr:alpha-glucan family phosphorylase [Bacteroidales bacterium]
LDGWWVEGYKEGAGWALPIEQAYDDNNFQNELDAATIYQILENDIAPAYYNVDRTTGRSREWIGYIKNTIAKVACDFTTNRMLTDYINQYYAPQSEEAKLMKAQDFAKARELAAWKTRVRREWENVNVISRTQPATTYDLTLATPYHAEMELQLGALTPDEVGLEAVFAQTDIHGKLHIVDVQECKVEAYKDGVAKYSVDMLPEKTGAYQVGARVFAKNPLLPHRQAFECVKWL